MSYVPESVFVQLQSRSKLDFQRVVNNDRDRKDSPRCGPLLFAKGHVEMIRRRMPPFPSGNVRRGGGMSDPPIGERRVTVSPPPALRRLGCGESALDRPRSISKRARDSVGHRVFSTPCAAPPPTRHIPLRCRTRVPLSLALGFFGRAQPNPLTPCGRAGRADGDPSSAMTVTVARLPRRHPRRTAGLQGRKRWQPRRFDVSPPAGLHRRRPCTLRRRRVWRRRRRGRQG